MNINNSKFLLFFYALGITACSSHGYGMNMGDRGSGRRSPSGFRKSDLKNRPEYSQARDRVLREDEQRERESDRSSSSSSDYSSHSENVARDFARDAQREQAAAARAYGSSEGHVEVGTKKSEAAKAALNAADKYKKATDSSNRSRSPGRR